MGTLVGCPVGCEVGCPVGENKHSLDPSSALGVRPSGQYTQVLSETAPGLLLYFPLPQSSQVDAEEAPETTLNDPFVQLVQLVCPISCTYRPL